MSKKKPFRPTHRLRKVGETKWTKVRADGVEPQTYYDADGATIYAGIWFRDMEVERLPNKVKITIVSERKIIDVRPSALSGYPDRIEVDVCVKCAAVVFDPVAHDLWHSSIEKAGA